MRDRDLALGWLRKAHSDLKTAKVLLGTDGPYDTACFHAQQAGEKALKAVLAGKGRPIPRTHSLEELALLCQDAVSKLVLAARDLVGLTPLRSNCGTISNSGRIQTRPKKQ